MTLDTKRNGSGDVGKVKCKRALRGSWVQPNFFDAKIAGGGQVSMRLNMISVRTGCAVAVTVCSLYFIIHVLSPAFINSASGYAVGNRRRMVAVAKLELLMVVFSLLAFYKLRSYFTPTDQLALPVYENGKKSFTSDEPYILLRVVLVVVWLLLSHLTYVLYFFPVFASSLIFDLSQVALGIWTYFVVILFMFTSASLAFYFGNAYSLTRPAFRFLLRSRFIRCACTDERSQMNATLIATFILSMITFYSSDRVIVKELVVPLRDLPTEALNVRFALISDIHAGSTVYRRKFEKVVSIVNRNKVDAVFFVGDAVDGTRASLHDRLEPIRNFSSAFGTYFVSGNHEYYYGDAMEWFSLFTELGVHVLNNSNVNISGICVAGVNDYSSGRNGIAAHHFDAVSALSGCPQDLPVIALSHNPAAAKEIAFNKNDLRVDLILSGHTHAGQFYTVAPFVYWVLPYFYGLYDVSEKTRLFVSAGTLYQGPPMKMWGLSEIWIVSFTPSG